MAENTVENALLILAGRCDGARLDDGEGFNAWDTGFGHALAEQVSLGRPLSGKQRRAAWRMLAKYRDQLSSVGVDYDAIDIDRAASPSGPGPAPQSRPPQAARGGATVSATVERDRIYLRTPFRLKDVCKSIPAHRWDPNRKAWTYPETPASAATIAAAFAGERMKTDAGFDRLLEQVELQREAGGLRAARDLPPVPVSKTDAWLHQRQAFWFAKDLDAVMLAMEMGTGKTKVIVDLVINAGDRSVLIVCPLFVIDVWAREFGKHAGSPTHLVRLNEGSVQDKQLLADELLHECTCGLPHILVINYESATRKPFADWAKRQRWDRFVIDESHRIKAPGGVWSRWAHAIQKVSRRRAALTGTPMAQGPLDVYGQFRALDPGIFGLSYTAFQHKYAVMGGYGGYEVLRYQNEDEFRERYRSITYEAGEDVLDLPETQDLTHPTTLSPRAKKLYRQLEEELYADIDAWRHGQPRQDVIDAAETLKAGDGYIDSEMVADAGDSEVTLPNVLVKLLRLQQLTGGALHDDSGELVEVDDSKARLLEQILTDIGVSDDEPVVVFCRFIHDLDVVERIAEKLNLRYGELSGRRRDALSDEAMMSTDVDIAAVQIQAGGVGIDLTRARYAIYYSLGYSLSDYLQSRRRVHRPGQKRTTFFLHLVCMGTKDEDVYEALEARQKVIDMILER